jgi:hypothetical protein
MGKNLFFIVFAMISVCAYSQSNTEQVTAFLDGIVDFKDVQTNEHNPIPTINQIASSQADEMIALSKSNISETFAQAKKYSHCLITVGQHTFVLVKNWNDCKQSGAWGTCMPYGEGFIKRSSLEKVSDHINNIIGVPDSQRRTVFLFK